MSQNNIVVVLPPGEDVSQVLDQTARSLQNLARTLDKTGALAKPSTSADQCNKEQANVSSEGAPGLVKPLPKRRGRKKKSDVSFMPITKYFD